MSYPALAAAASPDTPALPEKERWNERLTAVLAHVPPCLTRRELALLACRLVELLDESTRDFFEQRYGWEGELGSTSSLAPDSAPLACLDEAALSCLLVEVALLPAVAFTTARRDRTRLTALAGHYGLTTADWQP